jgi:dihydrofolate reductase
MLNGIADSNGNLLYKIKEDLNYFKSVTSGKVVVMGRKTWDSLPKKPLEKRKNYIITRDERFNPIGAKVIHSIDSILELSKKNDIFVIGGGDVYGQLLPYADTMMLTHVHEINKSAKVFFPDYDTREWGVSFNKHDGDENTPSFTFATYTRKK